MTSAVIVSTARTPLAKSWKGSFNMTHGATLGGHAVEHAIKRAGSIDKAKVRDAIEATSGYVGLLGIYNMTPADHNGLRVDSLRILEVRDGRFTLAK